MMELELVRSAINEWGGDERKRRLELVEQANHLFHQAYLGGKLNQLWATIRGRSTYLLNLTDVTTGQPLVGRHYKGTQIVPIQQIRGSEGRSRDFDHHFQPLQGHTEGRWRSVALAFLTGVGLPPVQLIQVGEAYFVQDGHHRISVARALGQTYIDAEVVVWEVGSKPASARSKQALKPQIKPVNCLPPAVCNFSPR
jgi:hypothetical protein